MSQRSNAWNPAPPRTDPPATKTFLVVARLLILAWILVISWFVVSIKTTGSPDEAANKYFMRQLAASGQYRVDSGLPAEVNTVLYPRSSTRQGQFLASGSFLGLVQAGAVVINIFGVGAERFLTPLVALIALILLYLFLRRFWDRWWALGTTVLVALHPAWFGQMTNPYLHNGLFTAMLVIAGWAMVRLLERPTWWRTVLAGLFFGGALYFRPVEALWTVPIVVVLLAARKLWWQLTLMGLVTILAQLPWLLVNQELYGSALSSAYTQAGVFSDGEDVVEVVAAPAKLLFTPPGGAWSWHWLSTTWWYVIVLGSPISVLAVMALGKYLRRTMSAIKTLKLSLLAVPVVFLLVYYGTWDLYPTSTASQIGWHASYVRYWIMLYVALTVGAVVAIQKLFFGRMKVVVMAALLAVNLTTTFFHVNSGVRQRLAADRVGQERQNFILRSTEPDSFVIAGQQDKYLFGQRRIAYAWPKDTAGLTAVKNTVVVRPVYLYGTLNQFSERQLQTQLMPYNLALGGKAMHGSETLWKIIIQ